MPTGFTEIPIITNPVTGLVQLDYSISDSEITNIGMSFEVCELTLVSHGYLPSPDAKPVGQRTWKLLIRNPAYVSFCSDHLQNVADQVYVFLGVDRGLALDMKTYADRVALFPTAFTAFAPFYVFITPITGGDFFAAGDSVSLFCRECIPEN